MERTIYAIVMIGLSTLGCVGASEIVPIGKDTYLITGRALGGIEAGQGIIAATKKAGQFCSDKGLNFVFGHSQSSGNAAFGGESNQLVFSCLASDDPEYKRIKIRQDPTTVIEDARH
jgi:hypothetical protein